MVSIAVAAADAPVMRMTMAMTMTMMMTMTMRMGMRMMRMMRMMMMVVMMMMLMVVMVMLLLMMMMTMMMMIMMMMMMMMTMAMLMLMLMLMMMMLLLLVVVVAAAVVVILMLPLFSCLLVSLLASFCQSSFVLQMSSLAHQVVAKHAEHLSFASHLPVATSESSRLTPLQLVGNNPNQSFKENCKLYWCSTFSGLHPDFLGHRQNEQTSSKEFQRHEKLRQRS